MLDDDDGVAGLHQPLDDLQQFLDVLEVQTRRGLVQDVDGAARGPLGQLLAQLDPLGLAAGQGGGALAQADVAQAHLHEGLQLVGQHRDGLEQGQRLLHGHGQHVGDALALVVHFQGLAVVALALALLAGDVDVGQEMHLDLEHAVAFALLAAATLDVEAEAPGQVAPRLALRQLGEQFTQRREQAGVGGGVAPGGAADGSLVDVDDLVHQLQALDGPVLAHHVGALVQLVGQGLVQDLVHQGALARTRHPGDAGEQADGEGRVHLAQVVLLGPQHLELAAHGLPALLRQLDPVAAAQEAAGDGGFAAADLLGRALGHHVAAVLPGPGAQVHHVVGGQDGLQVVLHHQHRVAQVAHLLEGVQQLLVVPLVQADARLVQHVHHPLELGADLGGQPDALPFAAAEGGGGAVQGQVAQPDVVQEAQPFLDLLQHLFSDDGILALERQVLEPGPGLAHA